MLLQRPESAPVQPARLTILPGGWQLTVAADQSLLRAALGFGVRLPSACRNGSCRACVCRLISGVIRYQVDWPGLLAEEKAEGWILPCVAEPLGDVVIHAPAASALMG